jgi:DNA polymerase III delta subunit
MFFLFYGSDKTKARAAANKNIEAAKKKHPSAEFVRLNSDNFSINKLDEQISSQGLFYSASIVFCDGLLAGDDEDLVESIVSRAKEIADSSNFFILLEERINKKELDKLKKHALKIEEFAKPDRILSKKEKLALKGEKIDFFEFADALGARNRKALWALYQDALVEAVPSEEVHGIFFWQVKAMLAALKSKSAEEAGLNPFVYDKARRFANNYTEDKLKKMSSRLFSMYHEAHRGETDFPVSLERFILEI